MRGVGELVITGKGILLSASSPGNGPANVQPDDFTERAAGEPGEAGHCEQRRTVEYSTVQDRTVQDRTGQHSTVQD